MPDFDPQHQAVRETTHLLKDSRYWSRSPTRQRVYLNDVTELCREVAFLLNQAGITWADAEHELAEVRRRGGADALILQADEDNGGRGLLEFALCRAVQTAKDTIEE